MSEQMRSEFEAYRDARNALLEAEGHKHGSKWHVTNAHYPTWEQSRAALCVELPFGHTSDPAGSKEWIDAIHAAGVKTK